MTAQTCGRINLEKILDSRTMICVMPLIRRCAESRNSRFKVSAAAPTHPLTHSPTPLPRPDPMSCCFLLRALCPLLLAPLSAAANNSIHTSWLWHLHQPIYWPDHKVSD